MRRATIAASFLAVLLVFVPPAAASKPPEGLEIRDFRRFTLSSPFSGPVETIVMTNHRTITRGALMDVFVAVQNHSNDTTAGW
jgi:hypothetical protein